LTVLQLSLVVIHLQRLFMLDYLIGRGVKVTNWGLGHIWF